MATATREVPQLNTVSNFMRFALCPMVLGDHRDISISPEQFAAAADAHKRMRLFVASEEKFDAIARNYLDFESDMLKSALETALVGFGQGMEQMEVRRLLNRKLSNLLSATRSYIDFMSHSVGHILLSETDAQLVTKLFSEHYDKSLSYRTLEVLRNHAQHAGFPIQSVKYSNSVMRDISGTSIKKTVAPILDTEELAQNRRLKTSVVQAIAQNGKTVNLKRFIREYVASMASIHEQFRSLASPIFSADASVIQELIKTFPSSEAVPLYVASFEDAECIQKIFLSDGLQEYGDFLAAGNAHFTHANISFVSGELENDS